MPRMIATRGPWFCPNRGNPRFQKRLNHLSAVLALDLEWGAFPLRCLAVTHVR